MIDRYILIYWYILILTIMFQTNLQEGSQPVPVTSWVIRQFPVASFLFGHRLKNLALLVDLTWEISAGIVLAWKNGISAGHLYSIYPVSSCVTFIQPYSLDFPSQPSTRTNQPVWKGYGIPEHSWILRALHFGNLESKLLLKLPRLLITTLTNHDCCGL